MTVTLSDTTRTARKHHVCSFHPYKANEHGIMHSIEPGEKYRVTTHIGDDGPYTWKSCAYHDAVALVMMRDPYFPGDGITAMEMTEQFYEWWGDAEQHAERGLPYPVPFDWRQR
jgi:hypothetical protein